MEELHVEIPSRPQGRTRDAVLVGVVASGHCEILLERRAADAVPDRCIVTVHTSAHGFGPIWGAVLDDCAERHALGGLKIEIHDVGATPAIVTLRMAQAIEAWEEAHG